ncbi:MAG TPA: hypothetical protein VMT24_06030, partial [Aggregatilineaceae bacterium]|nr:hypothetical protein [Aggregatilineaceae bacterium]
MPARTVRARSGVSVPAEIDRRNTVPRRQGYYCPASGTRGAKRLYDEHNQLCITRGTFMKQALSAILIFGLAL